MIGIWKKYLWNCQLITIYCSDILSEKLKGKRGRNTRSRTPPVRIPLRKGQKQPKNNKQQQQQQERDLEEEAVKSNLGRTKQQFNMPVR